MLCRGGEVIHSVQRGRGVIRNVQSGGGGYGVVGVIIVAKMSLTKIRLLILKETVTGMEEGRNHS